MRKTRVVVGMLAFVALLGSSMYWALTRGERRSPAIAENDLSERLTDVPPIRSSAETVPTPPPSAEQLLPSRPPSHGVIGLKEGDAYTRQGTPVGRIEMIGGRKAVVPVALEGFFAWPASRQAKAIDELGKRHDLPAAEVDFLLACLTDSRLGRLVRNSVANALQDQETYPLGFAAALIRSIDDRDETMAWRQYAIQQLAAAMPHCEAPAAVERKLLDLFEKAEPDLAAQAMTMLDFAESKGHIRLGSDFNHTLALKVDAANAAPVERAAALGLLGSRGAVGEVETLRRAAQESSDYQRIAVASLGLVGDASDIAIVEPLVSSDNKLLAIAAQKAVERLRARTH